MNHLNDDNIDEIMFQLIEGEIQGAERTQLLDAIHADKKYSILWHTWQQTVLNSHDELLVMNTNKLKKNQKAPVTLWIKYAAACVVLTISLSIWQYMNTTSSNNFVEVEGNKNPKTNIIRIPEKETPQPSMLVKDTTIVIPLKEKIKTMAKDDELKFKNNFKQPIINDSKIIEIQENKTDNNQSIDKIANIVEPIKNNPQQPKEEKKPIEETKIAQVTEKDYTIVSFESESIKSKKTNNIQNKVTEKTNLIARILSKPKLQIVNDSSTYSRRKLVLENKQYKIMAGF